MLKNVSYHWVLNKLVCELGEAYGFSLSREDATEGTQGVGAEREMKTQSCRNAKAVWRRMSSISGCGTARPNGGQDSGNNVTVRHCPLSNGRPLMRITV